MFHCFGGKCRLISVFQEMFADNQNITYFDRNWQKMPFEYCVAANKGYVKKPDTFDEMLRFAEALSENIPYVRIDFREAGGRAYFAETEFQHACGFCKFSPEEWDSTLGDWIELPIRS